MDRAVVEPGSDTGCARKSGKQCRNYEFAATICGRLRRQHADFRSLRIATRVGVESVFRSHCRKTHEPGCVLRDGLRVRRPRLSQPGVQLDDPAEWQSALHSPRNSGRCGRSVRLPSTRCPRPRRPAADLRSVTARRLVVERSGAHHWRRDVRQRGRVPSAHRCFRWLPGDRHHILLDDPGGATRAAVRPGALCDAAVTADRGQPRISGRTDGRRLERRGRGLERFDTARTVSHRLEGKCLYACCWSDGAGRLRITVDLLREEHHWGHCGRKPGHRGVRRRGRVSRRQDCRVQRHQFGRPDRRRHRVPGIERDELQRHRRHVGYS